MNPHYVLPFFMLVSFIHRSFLLSPISWTELSLICGIDTTYTNFLVFLDVGLKPSSLFGNILKYPAVLLLPHFLVLIFRAVWVHDPRPVENAIDAMRSRDEHDE